MSTRRTSASWMLPAALLVALAAFSCVPSRSVESLPSPEAPSLAPEVDELNLAAYPESSYTVKAGDTPATIAARLGIDPVLLAKANDFKPDTVLKPGDLIIVPKVADRNPAAPAVSRSPLSSAQPSAVASKPVSVSIVDGRLRAISAGTVAEVHTGYPGLGDVVIIESDAEKVIYSGTFAPAVSKGADVSAGDVIATQVEGRTVRVSHFAR